MKSNIRNLILIAFCLYSLFFLIGSTLAPILAQCHQFDLSGKLTATYMFSCHQNPCRSFWIFGYPIALCCRCLGFYLGVTVSSLIIVIKGWEISYKKFIALFFIAFTDIVLNYTFKLNTGNYTRFLIGIIMGFLFTALICFVFRLRRRKSNVY